MHSVDEYDEDVNDLVDALVLPAFMLQAAVGSLDKVLDTGQRDRGSGKEAFVSNLLSSILIVISMGGGAIAKYEFVEARPYACRRF